MSGARGSRAALRRALRALAALVCTVGFVACGTGDPAGLAPPGPPPRATLVTGTIVPRPPIPIPSDVGKDDSARLTGAGATFPTPLYTRWFADYQASISPRVQVNYQAIGSGGGVKQITERTVDFGASDAPMSDAEMAKAPGIQHIPMTLGAVVITYNIKGLSAPLRLDGETLARIYLGKIGKWDDPAIASDNPGVTLPDADIVVVHRSDGSGTSFVFTDFLSSTSEAWNNGPGVSKNPQWPEGLGGQGNDGVTQQVKQNDNSIGYVELIYAHENHLPIAEMRNASGEFVAPTGESTSKAGTGIVMPDDYRVSIVNSPAPGAYPIASFTYILLYRDQRDAAKGKALVDLLWWAVHDGQRTTEDLDYAPLPEDVVRSVERTLTTSITSHGMPLLPAPGGGQ